MQLILLPAYPLLVHFAVLRNSPYLAGLALLVLAAFCLYRPLVAGRGAAWLGLGAIALGLTTLVPYDAAIRMLYLPPIAWPLAVLLSFAISLLPGRTPLVSAIAARVHQPMPPGLAAYTRGVTWLWTLVIALMLTANLALTFSGSRLSWSAFTNGGDYLVLVAVFLGEYLVRRLRFRTLEQPRFIDYLRLVFRYRPGVV